PSALQGVGSSVDAYWPYCVLACPFSTTLKDMSGHVATVVTATVDSTQSKFGGSSARVTGGLTVANATEFQFHALDFPVECLFRENSLAGNNEVVCLWGTTAAGTASWDIRVTTVLEANLSTTGSNFALTLDGTTTLSTNTWYHAALTRRGTTVRLF